MKCFIRIRNKILYEIDKIKRKIQNLINIKLSNKIFGAPKVKSIDSTLEKLMAGTVSMSRFGDGEYKIMIGKWNGFQSSSKQLKKRLREIIKLNGKYDDFIVCIPNIPNGLDLLVDEAKRFWEGFLVTNGLKWYRMLNINKQYYNAHVTRLYYDWEDKSRCGVWFNKLKKVWDNENIVLIEGEKSRLGVGNDLFNNAKSVGRILAPSNNAFDKYNEVLAEAKKQPKDKLILIALGQTATVLAYDLFSAGYRALDIGHIDIEYEWYLKQVKEKVAVPGKYVKEVQMLSDVRSINDNKYNSEIISKII